MASVHKTARAKTRDFMQAVQARAQADPKFRDALLREGLETMLAGDVETEKAIVTAVEELPI